MSTEEGAEESQLTAPSFQVWLLSFSIISSLRLTARTHVITAVRSPSSSSESSQHRRESEIKTKNLKAP